MKKIILAVLMPLFGMANMASAQQPTQVAVINAGGDFNNGGTTALKEWKLKDMPLRTSADSILLATKDTVKERLQGIYNSVTFVIVVDSLAGRVDSTTVTVQGSVDTSTGTDFATINTFTCANVAKNVFSCVVNNGGNPYSNYRLLFATTNRAVLSQARWKSKMLVRYVEEEDWEVLVTDWRSVSTSP